MAETKQPTKPKTDNGTAKPKTERKPRASKKLDIDTIKGHFNSLQLTEKVAFQKHVADNIASHRKELQEQLALIDQQNG